MQRTLIRLVLITTILVPVAIARATARPPSPPRHWVFLNDRDVTETALADAARQLPERTRARRALRREAPGLVDHRDLPVDAARIAAIQSTGARVHVVSRWLNAVSVECSVTQLEAIEHLEGVASTQPVRRGRRGPPMDAGEVSVPIDPLAGASFHGLAFDQLAQIDVAELHARGATAAGAVVGVLDTGFQRTHIAFNHVDHPLVVVAEHDFINDDGNAGPEAGDPSGQHNHGTYILGTLAGYVPNVYVGTAYDASFVLCKTEDTTDEYQGEEDNYVGGLEFCELNGADVATSSLGYIDWYDQSDLDGATAVTTIAMNIATANGMHCCTAAGNSGHDGDSGTSHLIAPSDALQVIACGATNIEGEIAGFSSDGPSADGRVKPELLACGVDTITVRVTSDTEYTSASGTSLSTPLVAGAVACLVQARPAWSVDDMRQFLFDTASDFAQNGVTDPLFVRGYGLVSATEAALSDCNGDGTPDPCSCTGDVDGDGAVSFGDLLATLAAWGPCAVCAADLDGDGMVGFSDLVALLAAWGDCV